MKKRLTAILLAFVLAFSLMPAPAFAASTSLKNKSVYYTPASDYISGDCILTSSKNMIRRACIMNGRGNWRKFTNSAIRGDATIWGLLWNSFKVDAEGMVYQVDSGLFSGNSSSERIKEIRDLLKVHPEGIVVHGVGAAYTGTHGVLALYVKNGEIYAADSTHNTGINNNGIESWEDTTMLKPSKVSKYWYISGISTSTKTEPSGSAASKETKKSKLRVVSPRTPSKIRQGKSFGIWGEVRSDKIIKKVTVRILNSSGKAVITVTKNPGKKLFKIVKVDKKIKFGNLKKGLYTYQVIATDSAKTLTLVNKTFIVH